jgi:uncharacterized protein (UPF0276 family)
MNSNWNFGCEINSNLVASAPVLLNGVHSIGHFQITVPSMLRFADAMVLSDLAPVVLHSNILNTFGENNWQELRVLSARIKTLNPVHLVEHFTLFRDKAGKKSGVAFDLSDLAGPARSRILDTMKKWQDMVGVPVLFENVPITKHVPEYLDFLMEQTAAAGCEIVCDVPHLLISGLTAGISDNEMKNYALQLNPRQVHVGGISAKNRILQDNHHSPSEWIAGFAKAQFPNAKYITLEQSPQIPTAALARQLAKVVAAEPSRVPDLLQGCQGESIEELNDRLAQDAASFMNGGKALREGEVTGDVSGALAYLEKYMPFFYPMGSINEHQLKSSEHELLLKVAAVATRALRFASWASADMDRDFIRISCGRDGQETASKLLCANSTLSVANPCERKIRFENNLGFWVEVATPGEVPSNAA